MDRSVDPALHAQLMELAKSLLSHSTTLESPLQEGRDPFQALEELGSLGELTAQSFVPLNAGPRDAALLDANAAPTPAESAHASLASLGVPSANETNAPLPPLQVPARYTSKNMQDDSVLRALMEYHRLHAPVVGAKSSPQAATASPQEKTPLRPGFAPAEIPIVEARPKDASAMKRSTRPTAPVLRTPDES